MGAQRISNSFVEARRLCLGFRVLMLLGRVDEDQYAVPV